METTKLTLEKDYELIRANFEAQPKTIIMQYADKFWIQLIKPLVKDEYDSLDQTFYYENIDPTLGYENSMFHFERNMSVQFTDRCPDDDDYAVSPTAYDSCKAKRQSFSFSFVDPATGDGLDVSSSEAGAWIVDNPADRETTKREDTRWKRSFATSAFDHSAIKAYENE